MDTTTAPTPDAPIVPPPAEESFETALNKKLNIKPEVKKMDFKSLEDLPDIQAPTPSGVELVSENDASEFLKVIDTEKREEPKSDLKNNKEEDKPSTSGFDISDIDLSKDVDDVVIPQDKPKSKKSKEDNIAELRKKADLYEIEAKTKEEKLAEYQKKLEEMEGELERTAFERSPKFKQAYQAPYEASLSEAQSFAEEIVADKSVAEKALSLKGRERIEFIDDAIGGGAAASHFLSLINKADEKRGALEDAMVNYKETNSRLQHEAALEQSELSQKVEKNFERIAKQLAAKSEFFREVDGDNDHNKLVKGRLDMARQITYGEAPENIMASAPFLASVAQDALNKLDAAERELAKYKARAREDASVEPRIGGATLSDDSIEAEDGKPKSALDSIKKQLRKL